MNVLAYMSVILFAATGALACGSDPAGAPSAADMRADMVSSGPGELVLRLYDRSGRGLEGRAVALRAGTEEFRGMTDGAGELRLETAQALGGDVRVSATTARREGRLVRVVGSWLERLSDVGESLGEGRWRIGIEEDTAEQDVELEVAPTVTVDPTLAGLDGFDCIADVQLPWGRSAVREGLRRGLGPCDADWTSFIVADAGPILWGVLEVYDGTTRIALGRYSGGAVDGLGFAALVAEDLPAVPGLGDATRQESWAARLGTGEELRPGFRRRVFFSPPNGRTRLFVGDGVGDAPPPPLPEGFTWQSQFDGLEVETLGVGVTSLRLLEGGWAEPVGWLESDAVDRTLGREGFWR